MNSGKFKTKFYHSDLHILDAYKQNHFARQIFFVVVGSFGEFRLVNFFSPDSIFFLTLPFFATL